ncbi:MAG: hypothetical protein EA397_14475 [Deltaproteobacteria bacterium]|nr:MAG: hypothetical protein EA397_14475 [Deltaproteobacteria bacterium]
MTRTPTATGLQRALHEAFERDPELVVIGEGVSRSFGLGGIYHRAAQAWPDRILETPVAERAALGLAVGLALAGRRVVVELSATGRLHGALEVLAELGQIASQGEFQPSVILRVPVGGQAGKAIDRPITQALTSLVGVRVVSPSTASRVIASWRAALTTPGVTVILEPRALLDVRCDWPEPISLDHASPQREGRQLTLITWGTGLQASLDAAESLEAQGIDAAVLDLHCLHPLDVSTLGQRVRDSGRAVLVEPAEGGLGGALLGAAVEQGFLYLEAPLVTCRAEPAAIVAAASQTAHY